MFHFQYWYQKCKIFSIGTNFYNWYQDYPYVYIFQLISNFFWLVSSKYFIYFQLVSSNFFWLVYYLFIFNWYHDALNWYIFSIGIIMFWFDFTPCWFFLFQTKRGEQCFIVYFNPFVDDWQKGEEVFEFICMFIVYL